MIYLCGPIFGRSDDECRDWRDVVKAALPHCIDPTRRDFRGLEESEYEAIVEGDLDDIDRADSLLVYFDRPSVGTAMEVFYGYRSGKRVVVVNASGGALSPWLRYHCHAVVSDLETAIRVLRK